MGSEETKAQITKTWDIERLRGQDQRKNSGRTRAFQAVPSVPGRIQTRGLPEAESKWECAWGSWPGGRDGHFTNRARIVDVSD